MLFFVSIGVQLSFLGLLIFKPDFAIGVRTERKEAEAVSTLVCGVKLMV